MKTILTVAFTTLPGAALAHGLHVHADAGHGHIAELVLLGAAGAVAAWWRFGR